MNKVGVALRKNVSSPYQYSAGENDTEAISMPCEDQNVNKVCKEINNVRSQCSPKKRSTQKNPTKYKMPR